MTGSHTIGEITTWLEGLQRGAGDVRAEGLASGANQAVRDGFRPVLDRDGLRVPFRGRTQMTQIEPAIERGLRAAVERRTQ